MINTRVKLGIDDSKYQFWPVIDNYPRLHKNAGLSGVEIPDDAVNINANVVKILRKYPFKYRTNIPNFKEVHEWDQAFLL